ncbi:MAG: hypothetical protein JW775_01370 [Candidatus Aminicenantes bacterium]|nr:hypothetical protein [Candidatus Aminicenantes bacterium]
MKDKERNVVGLPISDVEIGLGRLKPVAAPPGLRRRVLDRAREARGNVAMTPGLRITAVAGSLLIIILLGIEPALERNESVRLAAILNNQAQAGSATGPASELADVLAVAEGEAGRLARLRALAVSAGREERINDLIEARESLKGWLDNETSEDLD